MPPGLRKGRFSRHSGARSAWNHTISDRFDGLDQHGAKLIDIPVKLVGGAGECSVRISVAGFENALLDKAGMPEQIGASFPVIGLIGQDQQHVVITQERVYQVRNPPLGIIRNVALYGHQLRKTVGAIRGVNRRCHLIKVYGVLQLYVSALGGR